MDTENPPSNEPTPFADYPRQKESRLISVGEHIALSAFWFGTNFLWGALLVILLPGEVEAIAPTFRVTAVGLLTALAAVVALVVPLIAGALSDRCASNWGRRRPFIATGVVINLVGLALMYVAYSARTPLTTPNPGNLGDAVIYGKLIGHASFLFFLLAYMVVQLGNNIATAAYSGVIPDLVPEDQRGRASGYMALMTQLGTLFGVIGCGLLLSHAPDLIKYIALAVALSGAAAITILGIRETALPTRPPKMEWGPYLKSLWINPKVYPDFAWVWITRALVMLGFYGILPFVNYYFMDVIGLPQDKASSTASMLTAIILVAAAASAIYGGVLSDRVGRKKVVYIANSVIAVVCLGFMVCRTIPPVLGMGVLFGLGFGAYTSVDWALGTDVLPTKDNAGKEMAVWHISMTLPQSIAAPIAAYLIGMFPTTTVGDTTHYSISGYSALFVFSAVCFGLGAYLLRNVRGVK